MSAAPSPTLAPSALAPPPPRRAPRRNRRLLRWFGLAVMLFVAWVAGAYKGWLPGSEIVGDQVDDAKAKLRVLGFRMEASKIPAGSVVFLGSSSIAAFPLAVCYPGAPWLNRGVNAEDVPAMIERLDWSLPVARPAGVVIHAGQNDLRARARPVDEIVDSIARATDVVRARFPDVPITLVEIMPLCEAEQGSMARLDQLNEGLRALAERRGLGFVHTSRPPLTADHGALLPTMAGPDHKHMHIAGYQIFARMLAEEGGAATEPLLRAFE